MQDPPRKKQQQQRRRNRDRQTDKEWQREVEKKTRTGAFQDLNERFESETSLHNTKSG
jgi:hypothetical protein